MLQVQGVFQKAATDKFALGPGLICHSLRGGVFFVVLGGYEKMLMQDRLTERSKCCSGK